MWMEDKGERNRKERKDKNKKLEGIKFGQE